jgi:hypothetical protein
LKKGDLDVSDIQKQINKANKNRMQLYKDGQILIVKDGEYIPKDYLDIEFEERLTKDILESENIYKKLTIHLLEIAEHTFKGLKLPLRTIFEGNVIDLSEKDINALKTHLNDLYVIKDMRIDLPVHFDTMMYKIENNMLKKDKEKMKKII